MDNLLTVGNITFAIGIIAIIFSIYNKFHQPQEELEKKQIIDSKDIANKATLLAQKEMENKADVLAKQFQWEREANEKKFVDFGLRLDNSTSMAQKEIHSIDLKLELFVASQNLRNEENSNNFTKLFTLLEERLPARTNIKND